ncbi:hypothetical protein LTR04_000896 [Oleoguttula sp. CCFEE 6159]|nr:hypothetical protein LTR04_000896 [Oleoguttula sp. CCFEE 6159]
MAKRLAESSAQHSADPRHAKRQRLDQPEKQRPKVEDIHSARQLQLLLKFQQDAAPQLRSGIQSFKAFLESIVYAQEDLNVPRQRAILGEYLELEKPKDPAEKDIAYLSGLMQTWSWASQSNNDHLVSAVSAVLALLLKTLSKQLEFRDHGISICRTILQPAQLKLVSRSLTAPKHKEHVISPCLRMLTEIVSFDGDAVARQVFLRRDYTFDTKILARNLGIRKGSAEATAEDRRKPSVRSNAIRYLLAHFTYQDETAKTVILNHSHVVKALFDHIRDDSPEVATEIINVVKAQVVLDASLSKFSKRNVLTERTLSSIASLSRAEQSSDEIENEKKSIDIVAHEFLLLVCTTPELGALRSSSGWYPPGTDKKVTLNETEENLVSIDLGLDSIEWYGRHKGRASVRNTVLASFIQNLRPYANELELELILAIFKSAPELVADYFSKKTSFTFDPKLTATWIGYSSFLFSTVQLSVPKYFGREDGYSTIPPPVSIVIESILPQPLRQKVLARCLNQNSSLITFFAVRLLTIAFQKLRQVLQSLASSPEQQPLLRRQASAKLLSAFCQRCPKMKDVVAAFRNMSEDNMVQREAITRLLALYYELTPQIALDEKFDVSIALAAALSRAEMAGTPHELGEMRLLELNHLVDIAHRSPNMQWWRKPETLRFTPFMTLLRLVVARPKSESIVQIQCLLSSVVTETGILQQETEKFPLDALVLSLASSETWSAPDAVFDFLDDCLRRLVAKAVKYQDDLDNIITAQFNTDLQADCAPVSLLWSTLKEQWPFVAKSKPEHLASILRWIVRLSTLLRGVGEDATVLEGITRGIVEAAEARGLGGVVKRAMMESKSINLTEDRQQQSDGTLSDAHSSGRTDANAIKGEKRKLLETERLPHEDENHPGLNRWMQKEIDEAVEDGAVGDLVLCLCSKYSDIRRQALAILKSKLIPKIENSTYSEWEQVDLLLGELIETSRTVIESQALPYIVGVFAARALTVLTDPSHFMYLKINKFLQRGPSWNIGRLPSYWAEKTILAEPDDDDAYHKEVGWLVDLLTDGLRSTADMDIYRARNVFERVLVLYGAPSSSKQLKEKLLRLVYRATLVEGSTTLITRSGLLSWIHSQVASQDENRSTLQWLAKQLYDSCDRERVDEWSWKGASITVQALSAAVEASISN